VASCVGRSIRRPADTAARYGGEEFVVVLPDTSTQEAAQIAETIRTAMSDLGIEHARSEYGHLTASVGVASRRAEQDANVSALIAAADEALRRQGAWP
jgi:diguanylate cyclase (GGDEF)-like protein